MKYFLSLLFFISSVGYGFYEYDGSLKAGQCVEVGAGGITDNVVPDTEYSGLHPDPNLTGCYPRVLIDGQAYGLTLKVKIGNEDLCEYLIWSDIGLHQTAPYRCHTWSQE